MDVSDQIKHIRATLPQSVALVAVSKFHPVETIMEAYGAGQRIFGENRIQELAAKQPILPGDIEWHFIGTLQTNKVKYIVPFIHTIQSIDSRNLLEKVEKEAARCNRHIRVLLEVHIAQETTKHGFSADECRTIVRETQWATAYPHLILAGLMGMATFTDDKQQVRREFQSLRTLFDELKTTGAAGDSFAELSMGMTDDYHLAIEEGSTMVRIGTAIFGKRNYKTIH